MGDGTSKGGKWRCKPNDYGTLFIAAEVATGEQTPTGGVHKQYAPQ
ncbi:hypothetical protein Poly41_51360 [Novipirellula artificiosorum]|uniref:Uncharacterized protein n=1 Tax=Novipirellula artificiosorum TaxID=2528016 RepID=A0A5C6D8W5_9BACT|nr:hypothetical protein Poly41_51360 [Novipirellula artificiosorum]